jgi:D-alanyl-D-alanine carboxypeptidase/D-alanyl-D-alanine-endopeptidase (penicillin-binding protein 4)
MVSLSTLSVLWGLLLLFGAPAPTPAPGPSRGLSGPAWTGARPPDLAATVAQAQADPAFRGLEVSLAVGCASGQGNPALWQADALRNPASGAKLLTTAAALARFGPGHRFESVLEGALPVDGVVQGPLILVPSGAPDLQAAALPGLAKALAKRGVRSVRGDVLIDLAGFEARDGPPAFDQKQTDAAYRPRVPVLGVGDGAVTVTVKPGRKVGDAVRVTTDLPRAAVQVASSARTVAGKDRAGLTLRVGAEVIEVTGSLGAKAPPQVVRLRHPHPAEGARQLLREALREAGVRVTGKVRLGGLPSAEGAAAGRPVEGARTRLWRQESASVAEIIAIINVKSNNYWAESLLRLLSDPSAGPLSFDGGARAATALLATRLGLPLQTFRIVNGSGLYDATRVSARGMLHLLVAHGGEGAAARAFRASLARAGESGTLAKRLEGLKGRVLAKTGTLAEAVSLSGYVTPTAGCPLAFTALVEGPMKDRAGAVVAAIDRWVEALAGP